MQRANGSIEFHTSNLDSARHYEESSQNEPGSPFRGEVFQYIYGPWYGENFQPNLNKTNKKHYKKAVIVFVVEISKGPMM